MRPRSENTRRRHRILPMLAVVATVAVVGCSDDEPESTVFGPASTVPPARTIPPEARTFCGLGDDLLAVGDVFDQLEEPLQRLIEKDYAGAVEPMGQLYDALEQGGQVLADVISSAPPAIADDVEAAVGPLATAIETVPSRETMLAALEAGDDIEISTLLSDFERALAQAGTADPAREAASAAMQEYVAATC